MATITYCPEEAGTELMSGIFDDGLRVYGVRFWEHAKTQKAVADLLSWMPWRTR